MTQLKRLCNKKQRIGILKSLNVVMTANQASEMNVSHRDNDQNVDPLVNQASKPLEVGYFRLPSQSCPTVATHLVKRAQLDLANGFEHHDTP